MQNEQVSQPDKRQTQVDTEMDLLKESLERLHDAIGSHERMIKNVLKDEQPEKEGESKAQDHLVNTADNIRTHRFRVIDATRRICRITERVEV